MFLTVHMLMPFTSGFKWRGKLYSGRAVRYGTECVHKLVAMRSPETVSELMQFLQAANLIRLSLLYMGSNGL